MTTAPAQATIIPVSTHQTTSQDRYAWKEGSEVEVYLRMKNRWVGAKITNVFIDKDGEWLVVNVLNKAIFELSRLDEMLRRPKTPEEIQADIEEQKRQEREKHKKEEEEKQQKEKERAEMLATRQKEFQKQKMIETKDVKRDVPAKSQPKFANDNKPVPPLPPLPPGAKLPTDNKAAPPLPPLPPPTQTSTVQNTVQSKTVEKEKEKEKEKNEDKEKPKKQRKRA